MSPSTLVINPGGFSPSDLAPAIQAFSSGSIVIFPTETVYGIGAALNAASAFGRLNQLKGRPENQPLLMHCTGLDQVRNLVAEMSLTARRLADSFWPGPLALVLPATPGTPTSITGGTGTIGIRVPAHPLFRAMAGALGQPIVGTSANLHGSPPPHTFSDVPAEIKAVADLTIDAGPAGTRPSTVIDLTVSPPRLLRAGAISAERIEQVLDAPLATDQPSTGQ